MIEPRTRRHRRASTGRDQRPRAVVGVALALASVVAINLAVREPGRGAGPAAYSGSPALPVVHLDRPTAWRCPGPLPVGSGAAGAEIDIASVAARPVQATITVSRVAAAPRKAAAASGTLTTGPVTTTTSRITVLARSQVGVSLPTSGPGGFAAVSVEAASGGVGVAQATRSGTSWLSSPCAEGASREGFVPTGSTLGNSEVQLALYDPEVTPAVADVKVFSGGTTVYPPAFQGVVVPAGGMILLDVARWVPQSASVAISARTISGELVVGALETASTPVTLSSGTGSHRTVRRMRLTGSALLVGSAHAVPAWAFPAGPVGSGVTASYVVYVPGTRPARVRVAPPGRAGTASAVSELVPAGGVAMFAAPIPPKGTATSSSVVVSSSGGVGIVAARLFAGVGAAPLHGVGATSGTAGPQPAWLLPGARVGSAPDPGRGPTVADSLLLTNPSGRSLQVIIDELGSSGSPQRLPAVTVPAGSARTVTLARLLGGASAFAVEVRAQLPIFAEQLVVLGKGQLQAIPGIPVAH